MTSPKAKEQLTFDFQQVACLQFNTDGTMLASGGLDGELGLEIVELSFCRMIQRIEINPSKRHEGARIPR